MSTHIGPCRELTALDETERDRIAKQLSRENTRCGGCGRRRFDIGDALYLGFLFASEPSDAYMIALTCTNPRCRAPRGGMTLPAGKFLTPDRDRANRPQRDA